MNCKIALLIPLVLAVVPAAVAQDNYHVTTPSSWKLNAAQSDMGGDPNAMKSDFYHVTRDTDKWLAYTETMVGPDGKAMHLSFSAAVDGKPHPVTGMKGETCAISEGGKSHCDLPDGSFLDMQLHSLAKDAKQATFDATIKGKDGKEYHEKWVYDRQ